MNKLPAGGENASSGQLFFPRLTVHRQRRLMSAQALQLPTMPRLSIPGANLTEFAA